MLLLPNLPRFPAWWVETPWCSRCFCMSLHMFRWNHHKFWSAFSWWNSHGLLVFLVKNHRFRWSLHGVHGRPLPTSDSNIRQRSRRLGGDAKKSRSKHNAKYLPWCHGAASSCWFREVKSGGIRKSGWVFWCWNRNLEDEIVKISGDCWDFMWQDFFGEPTKLGT